MSAHRRGVLTSASLMVTGEAAAEAVELARQTPSLAVGLHLVLVDGRSALPASRIPHLVDAQGRFPNAPLRLGLRYFFHAAARGELAREIQAQMDLFAATGLPLSYVDSHQHMHLHPTVFNLLVPLAKRYGARGVRVPRDQLLLALRHDRRRLAGKVLQATVFGALSRWCALRLRHHCLRVCCRTYGLIQSGRMTESYVLSALRRIDEPSTEVYFHPTTGPRLDELGPNQGDLQTLLSPAVAELIRHRGLRLSTYTLLD